MCVAEACKSHDSNDAVFQGIYRIGCIVKLRPVCFDTDQRQITNRMVDLCVDLKLHHPP